MTEPYRVIEAANLSPYEYFRRLGRAMKPRYAFDVETDFWQWHAQALPAVLDTLGTLPDQVAPEPRLLSDVVHERLRTQRWLLRVSDGLFAIAAVNYPDGVESGVRYPAIICCAGHGEFGKEPVMGNRSTEALRAYVAETGLDYGRAFAQAGFVTLSIDWMGQGDLAEDRHEFIAIDNGGRDWCNLYYLSATVLGMSALGINVTHNRRLIDFAESLDVVDPDRIGIVGESCGGTLALWTTLADERIKATEIICYSDSFASYGLTDLNYCGSQITPGLFALVDVPDLQGLVAPRPLLTDIAAFDRCFFAEAATICQRKVRAVYDTSDCPSNLETQVFDSGHGWRNRASVPFFRKHLASSSVIEGQ